MRAKVFISYSHADEVWLQRLQVHLKSLDESSIVLPWDDTRIKAGQDWRREIREALETAVAAVLLVSADFLASKFIKDNELPPLLDAAEDDGLTILPVIVKPCRFRQTPNLERFQAVNDPDRPMVNLSVGEQEAVWVKTVDCIEVAVRQSSPEARQEVELAQIRAEIHTLSRSRNRFPKAQTVHITGSRDQPRAEIRGENLEWVTSIIAGNAPTPIVGKSQSAIEVILPSGFSGILHLESEHGGTTEVFCNCHSLEPRLQNLYQVIAADIPLYADRHCKIRRETVVGLLYSVLESGRQHTTIIPTVPGRYRTGQYLSHGPFEDEAVEESWYRDPRNGQIREAWIGALIGKPQILGKLGESRYGSIRVFPPTVHTEVNEKRTLNVRAYKSDGSAWREEDVTSITHWKSSNVRVASVKDGILYPKEFGSVTIEPEWQGLLSSAEIEVAHLSPGQRTIYYQGLRRLQQIRFDEADNLYIVNQSRSIFRLNRSGGLVEVVRIVIDDAQPTGLDCVCVDNHQNLIASTPYKEHCLRFRWNGSSYGTPTPVGQSVRGTKKAIAAAQDGTLFIAVMTGSIIRVQPDGSEDAFHTRDTTVNVAVGPNGLIYTTSTNERAVHIYQPDGKFVEAIPHGIGDSPADLFVDSAGTIYLPFFSSGKLLQISSGQLSQVTFVAEELGTPGGIAMDSKGRIYTSDFSGDAIYLLNQPRGTTTERT